MFDDILAQDTTDLEKVRQAFAQISGQFIENETQQLELNKALSDEEETIKSYIKIGVMQTAQEMFDHCYQVVTRRQAV